MVDRLKHRNGMVEGPTVEEGAHVTVARKQTGEVPGRKLHPST